jgi:hypothetical protein
MTIYDLRFTNGQTLGNLPEAIARATAALAIYEAIEDPNAPMVRAALAEWQA